MKKLILAHRNQTPGSLCCCNSHDTRRARPEGCDLDDPDRVLHRHRSQVEIGLVASINGKRQPDGYLQNLECVGGKAVGLLRDLYSRVDVWRCG